MKYDNENIYVNFSWFEKGESRYLKNLSTKKFQNGYIIGKNSNDNKNTVWQYIYIYQRNMKHK